MTSKNPIFGVKRSNLGWHNFSSLMGIEWALLLDWISIPAVYWAVTRHLHHIVSLHIDVLLIDGSITVRKPICIPLLLPLDGVGGCQEFQFPFLDYSPGFAIGDKGIYTGLAACTPLPTRPPVLGRGHSSSSASCVHSYAHSYFSETIPTGPARGKETPAKSHPSFRWSDCGPSWNNAVQLATTKAGAGFRSAQTLGRPVRVDFSGDPSV